LNVSELDGHFALVEGAVTIAFPMGIPDFDPVREILDDNEDLSNSAVPHPSVV
jgi:hypothetical protein